MTRGPALGRTAATSLATTFLLLATVVVVVQAAGRDLQVRWRGRGRGPRQGASGGGAQGGAELRPDLFSKEAAVPASRSASLRPWPAPLQDAEAAAPAPGPDPDAALAPAPFADVTVGSGAALLSPDDCFDTMNYCLQVYGYDIPCETQVVCGNKCEYLRSHRVELGLSPTRHQPPHLPSPQSPRLIHHPGRTMQAWAQPASAGSTAAGTCAWPSRSPFRSSPSTVSAAPAAASDVLTYC